ncbi:RING-H2 finger protein ATL13 [Canna indica]|uniref:RING-type E3 ubiquitin transferase n=1 Tax=Canna indica TaxID=4628 RepID=A0AAQ3QMV0_9LILI|nr:RING-H2 finger protein ATL13 [Canna indica]
MDWSFHESIREGLSSPPVSLPSPRPPLSSSPVINFENRISPSVLLIIVILAIIFFISGVLHLLVRFLLRPINREHETMDNVTALQGQLQQLFHLHDAGVDQSFIDTLPVFLYKAIIGLKDPFDCAVCLCEFEADDKLRLLPKCSHAFHLECIDTWLLSHSTCPLCRRSLLPDFSPPSSCSPMVLVLDSGSEASREAASGRRDPLPNAILGSLGDDDDDSRPSIAEKPVEAIAAAPEDLEAKVVAVKLGKFRNVDAGGAVGEGTSSTNGNLDQRRCFSMGSYEYVMDENSLLQVPIKPPKKPRNKKLAHRVAMSECDCQSRREGFKGFDTSKATENRGDFYSARINSNPHMNESFSVSKIWLQAKKDKSMAGDSSRRAFSFRLPLHRAASDESKLKSNASPAATASEFNVSTWEKSSSEVDMDVEVGSSNYSLGSGLDEAPSFARRTLLWLVGRQNKVGSHL